MNFLFGLVAGGAISGALFWPGWDAPATSDVRLTRSESERMSIQWQQANRETREMRLRVAELEIVRDTQREVIALLTRLEPGESLTDRIPPQDLPVPRLPE